MRRSGGTLYLIALLTAATVLTQPARQRAVWNNIPGITFMHQTMVLILTFPPRRPTQHE